jgi:hypothetical protein
VIRSARATAALIVLAALVSAPAPTDDVRVQVQAAYDAQCKAFLAADATAFAKTFDSTYIATALDGKQQRREEVVADAVAPQPGVTVSSCTVAIRSLTVKGDTATVMVTLTAGGTIAHDGTSSPFSEEAESTDTWNLGATPLETTSLQTGTRTTAAGKVVDEKGTMSTPPTSGR